MRGQAWRALGGRGFVVVLLILFVFSVGVVGGQESRREGGQELDWYIREAEEAVSKEFYGQAVEILRQGLEKYPNAAELNLMLGDLYARERLFSMALEEYREAEESGGDEYEVLYKIATTLGKLNRETEATRYLEQLHRLHPKEVSVINDLGWLYFKTYKLAEGKALLEEALETFGENRNILMTLATVYSGLYEYRASKETYLKAIEEAMHSGDRYFASVAFYNLSLLEHTFYHYNSALRYTDLSLEMVERAPGYLAQGELYMDRMDFTKAHNNFVNALPLDTTPLTTINLAELYQQFGMLEEALAYVQEVMEKDDHAWMYYFGTDINRHRMDLHEILYKVYAGLAWKERRRRAESLLDIVRKAVREGKYRVLHWYHQHRFRKEATTVGETYLQEGNVIDGYWTLYTASEEKPQIAAPYLQKAKTHELKVSPGAKPFYRQEEGKLQGNISLLESTLGSFHTVWERKDIAETLRVLIPLLRQKDRVVRARQYTNQLYAINPGGVLQYGVKLPLDLSLSDDLPRRRIERLLRRSGFELAGSEPAGEGAGAPDSGPARAGFRYRLSLTSEPDGTVSVSFSDSRGGTIRSRFVSTAQWNTLFGCSKIINEIVDTIFRIR
jgi:tetratricopeptide (TPR) repeat protein